MPLGVRLALIASFATAVSATPLIAQAPGYVRVSLLKASVIAGAGNGHGILTYRGRDYPFRASGVSLGVAAGASVSRFEGWASGIKEVSDFAGTYSAVGAGGTLIGGAGGIHLWNEKGVRMELRSRGAGIEAAANISVIRISLK
jgi:hypothetical protein